jgi:hypothetical protein
MVKVMYLPRGKRTVAGAEVYEFDNSDGSNVPNHKNCLTVPDDVYNFILQKQPLLFKRIDDATPIFEVKPTFEKPKPTVDVMNAPIPEPITVKDENAELLKNSKVFRKNKRDE